MEMPMKISDSVNVDVYRNLHKNTWSIRSRATGRVLQHADNTVVENAKFVVQPAGRQRVLQEQRKNVHAFVRGTINPQASYDVTSCNIQVKYNPYHADHFYEVETGEAVRQAPLVVLDTKGAWIQKNASTGPSEDTKTRVFYL